MKSCSVSQVPLLIHRDSWEVPGGRVIAAEIPKRPAARRKALRETGCVAAISSRVFIHPGLDTFHIHRTFLHDRLHEAPAESIHKREVNGPQVGASRECLAMIFAGRITDSLSVSSCCAFYAHEDTRWPGPKTVQHDDPAVFLDRDGGAHQRTWIC